MRPTAEDISRARTVFADHRGGPCPECPTEPAGRRCPRIVIARTTLTQAGLTQ